MSGHPFCPKVCIRLLALAVALVCGPQLANAAPIYGITLYNSLFVFDSSIPGTTGGTVGITGLQAGETVLAIDVRPATGQLYALGSTSRLYVVDPVTGVATEVGSGGAFTLSGTEFGFDFNPTVDRIRVVSDADQNLRLNPDSGALTATDTSLAYAAGDPNAAVDPNVVGSAYTNNFAGALTTTLYGIDSNLDTLLIQNPPNSGTLNTVGALGFNTSNYVGFDILSIGGANMAFASLTAPGGISSSLFLVNLTTGSSTLIGTIGSPGTGIVRDIAVAQTTPVPEPATLLLLGTGVVALARRRRRRR